MIAILEFDFMRRAIIAAALVGLIAPLIGVFLVQRRLALMGDGIGHIAVTGVALGLATGMAPTLTAVAVAIVVDTVPASTYGSSLGAATETVPIVAPAAMAMTAPLDRVSVTALCAGLVSVAV